jgi:hypothetical protein
MQTPYDFGAEQERLVYVKAVEASSLPEEVQAQMNGLEQLYAVHTADGAQLAIVADRKLAFALARQNDYQPVAVH